LLAAKSPAIDGLQFRDLRRTAVLRLAEAGCTVPEHSRDNRSHNRYETRILEAYLPRNFAMATAGLIKLENGDRERNKSKSV
jgi:hypothetical protein